MNPGGVVLIVAALWVGTQVLAGQALERLGLLSASGAATSGATSIPVVQRTREEAIASGYWTPDPGRLGTSTPK